MSGRLVAGERVGGGAACVSSSGRGVLLAIAERYDFYQRTRLSNSISPVDDMFNPVDLRHYFAVGESAIDVIADTMVLARRSDCKSILDLPCGAGRVTRHLLAFFHDADIFVSDLNKDKEAFVTCNFPVTSLAVDGDFSGTPERSFDLIFVGSLLTHLSERHFIQALSWFVRALNDDGLLIVTTNGRRTVLNSGTPLYLATEWRDAHDHYLSNGFGFKPDVGEENKPLPYGTSLTAPAWIMKAVATLSEVKILAFREAAWDCRQDVLCLQKKPLDAA